MLYLDGDGSAAGGGAGLVNNMCFPSVVAPSYAPEGQVCRRRLWRCSSLAQIPALHLPHETLLGVTFHHPHPPAVPATLDPRWLAGRPADAGVGVDDRHA